MRRHFSIGASLAVAASLCLAQAAHADAPPPVGFDDIPIAGTYQNFANDLWDGGLHFHQENFLLLTPGLFNVPTPQTSTYMTAGSESKTEVMTISAYSGTSTPTGYDSDNKPVAGVTDGQDFNLWYLEIALAFGNNGTDDNVTITGVSASDCTVACNPTITLGANGVPGVTTQFQILALTGFTDLTSVTITDPMDGGTPDIGWLAFDNIVYTPFVATGDNPAPPPLPPIPTGGVPEPSAWALMIVGFGGVGALLRRRRHAGLAAA